jgi:hypothetical protein
VTNELYVAIRGSEEFMDLVSELGQAAISDVA